jgi:Ca2+-binding RTX toxin-like protein
VAYVGGTNGNDSLVGTTGVDTIEGFAGNDTLVGLAGNDSLIGGLGDDRYVVGTGDILNDAGGVDTIETSVTWHLAAGFENLTVTGNATTSHGGNNLNNTIVGGSGANWIAGREGNDTLYGNGGGDTFNMSNGAGASYGNDFIDGGDGVDTIDFGSAARTAVFVDLLAGTASGGGTGGAGSATVWNIENVNGSGFDDVITGSAAANFLYGFNGNDTLDGGAGNDRLEGAAGSDHYVFSAAPGSANADTIVGFASGADKIVLNGLNLASNGNFASGDARFNAGAGFNSGQDSTDRIIYNTTTGQLWYDADGNGSGAAQLIATLQAAPSLAATDIVAQNSTGESATIFGTEGDDSLVGTEGSDTIDGLGGNDKIDGLEGADSLIGGSGNDTLFGGDANFYEGAGDTLDGGLGDDRYVIGRYDLNVLLADAGGTDTVVANSGWWTLAAGFENLELGFDWSSDGVAFGTGNAASNVITGFQGWWVDNVLDGAGGNDTLIGGDGDDRFEFDAAANYGSDFVDGRGGFDTLSFADGLSAIVVDWRIGSVDGGGSGGSGSVTYANIETIEGTAFGDHVTGPNGSGWGDYYYYYGPQVFAGAGNDTLVGGDNYDTFFGEDGNDHLSAGTGGSQLDGGAGADTLVGGDGYDYLYATSGSDSVSGGDSQDYIYLYTDGHDTVDGGEGEDYLYLHNSAQSAVVVDLAAGTIQGGAASGGGGASIQSIEGLVAGGFDDRISGNGVHNGLEGGLGNDTLFGGDGDDALYGGTGDAGFPDDDWLDGGLGWDYLWGAAGLDRYMFTTAAGDANVDYVASFVSGEDELRFDAAVYTGLGAQGRFSAGDERFYAAAGATSAHDASDRLIYDTSNYVLYYDADGSGGAAAQQVASFNWGTYVQATDIHVGFDEASSGIRGTSGNDTISGTAGDDVIDGLAGNDFLSGLAGNDLIFGGLGHDALNGHAGNDTLMGGEGDDSFTLQTESLGGYGVDSIDGGSGSDSLNITDGSASTAATVDLGAGTLSGAGGSATLVSIENVSGTNLGDRITGDAVSNVFLGNFGDDTLSGAGGNDSLFGQNGTDVLFGDDGRDWLWGGDGNDTLSGGNDDDTFQQQFDGSSSGLDVIDGGAGSDWLYYASTTLLSGVTVDLQAGTATGGGQGGAGSASFVSVENVTGSIHGDRLTGDAGANHLFAYLGDDTIDGGAGNDRLAGDSGADAYLFTQTPGAAHADTVLGGSFVSGTDKLVLDARVMSALGDSGSFAASDARFFAGGGASSGQDASDRIVYNTTNGQLWYDADGNGAGAAELIATLENAPTLAATDISVINGSTPPPPPPPTPGQAINGTTGNDTLTGGAGNDTINGNAGADLLQGLGGNDSLLGAAGWDTLQGGDGDDWLQPGAWSDTVTGGAGSDSFVWAESGNNTRDTVTDFVSGTDEVLLDNASMAALGANASWAAGDARFWAAAGATSGHDADDRLVYNTSNGNLYYDADGSGAGAAQVIATFQGGVVISASDITVI